MNAMDFETSQKLLDHWLTPQDHLSVDDSGTLCIEGHSARDLVEKYGSPLFVMSERTLRDNYRRIRAPFTGRWPQPVNVMYAIKANPNIAIRAILGEEGAGGDCFSMGELYATFEGGADPAKIVVNGSWKSDEIIAKAIEHGVCINMDSEEEVDAIERVAAAMDKPVPVAIRIKVLPEKYFADFKSDCFKRPDFFGAMRRSKWGETLPAAERIIKRLKDHQHVRMFGYHTHVGRASKDPAMFAAVGGELAATIAELHTRTGFAPTMVDLGGGWARERDPEASGQLRNLNPIEDYAEAVCAQMRRVFEEGACPLPELWLEPGRYIVGNAGVFLTSIGLIKKDADLGYTWINVDSSTNNLPQVDLFGYTYMVMAAEKMKRPLSHPADVVGQTCVPSIFGKDVALPKMEEGDLIAVLDAGMYAEAKGHQFNSLPRPATALVSGELSWLIRRRETLQDVFGTMVVPERFAKRG
ncbi:MAG: diaminopimelate decarboxylase [Pseudomonadota bacterium]